MQMRREQIELNRCCYTLFVPFNGGCAMLFGALYHKHTNTNTHTLTRPNTILTRLLILIEITNSNADAVAA